MISSNLYLTKYIFYQWKIDFNFILFLFFLPLVILHSSMAVSHIPSFPSNSSVCYNSLLIWKSFKVSNYFHCLILFWTISVSAISFMNVDDWDLLKYEAEGVSLIYVSHFVILYLPINTSSHSVFYVWNISLHIKTCVRLSKIDGFVHI